MSLTKVPIRVWRFEESTEFEATNRKSLCSRLMSSAEAAVNVAISYAIAVLTQVLLFPLLGLRATPTENLGIGAIFAGGEHCLKCAPYLRDTGGRLGKTGQRDRITSAKLDKVQ